MKIKVVEPTWGGKNASLGEMVWNLASRGVNVPLGFATTADAYWRFVETNGLQPRIAPALDNLRAGKSSLSETGAAIRRALQHGEWPDEITQEIALVTMDH